MNPCQAMCYVVSDETGEAVVIDPCAYKERERDRIVEYIETEGLKPVRSLLTHGHFDHLLAADLIHERYGLRPEVHRLDAPVIAATPERAREILGASGFTREIPMPTHWLSDGDIIGFGNHKLEVIHTPGHSPGSVFFCCKAEAVAFSGDTLFRNSIGNISLPYSSPDDMARSLRYINATLPDETTIYSGHTGKTTLGREKTRNTYMNSMIYYHHQQTC